MRIFLFVVLLFGLGKFGYTRYSSLLQARAVGLAQKSPFVKSSFGIPSSCQAKKYCITVFVAPWCPACKASQPTFQALQRYLPGHRDDVGFGVVVGGGSKMENEDETQHLSPVEALADNSGSILKNRGISAFPTWIINDASGKEIFRQEGGLRVSGDDQFAMLFAKFFKI